MIESEEQYSESTGEVAKVSFLSGKGGVGKTTFSVNLAKILSDGSRVLLVDCDITNRGASSLLLPKVGDKDRTLYAMLCKELCLFSIDARFEDDLKRSFISEELKNIFKANRFPLSDNATITKGKENEWVLADKEKFIVIKEGEKLNIYLKCNEGNYEEGTIQKIEENLFFLPSTATGQLIDWIDYKTEFEDLKNALSNIIETLVNKYKINCIIFDCRPGPDPLSGAAASISDSIILMTEADPVTFSGTTLLRLYLSEKYNVKENVYYVVNRVPEKYSVLDLDYIYSGKFLEILQILQVLSYVPFELDIFESLGEEKFVIEQVPRSILSSKLYVLAYDLFKKRFPYLITPKIKHMGEKQSEKFRKTTKFGLSEQSSVISIAIILMALGIGILFIRILEEMWIDYITMAAFLAVIYGAFILLFSRRFSKLLKRRTRTFGLK